VLETLNKYIDADAGNTAASRRFIHLPMDLRLDRRFVAILILSVGGHIFFYLSLIVLDSWTFRWVVTRPRSKDEELVKIIDLTGADNRFTRLRPPPEHPRRVDLDHLKQDPNLGNDQNLISRSPHPGSGSDDNQRGSGRYGAERADSPSARSIGQGHSGAIQTAQPPSIRPIEMKQAPRPGEPSAAGLPNPQLTPAPPPNAQAERAPARAARDAASNDASTEGSGRPRELGLRAVEAQYTAVVREEIYRENRRTMPKDWITNTLTHEVSAEFLVLLGRDGRVISVRMLRSCGYANLDKTARDAIFLASPFKGYPANLGDTFPVTVKVTYTPYG